MLKQGMVLLTAMILALPLTAAAQQGRHSPAEGPGWLGVAYESRWTQRDGQCEPQVLVEHVVQGSPAERAGLRPGDALVALNGRPVPATRLEEVARRLAPGDSVRLQVMRDGRARQITAIAARRPVRPPQALLPLRRNGASAASGPLVHMEDGALVVRNADEARGARGYWFATEDGRTVYRTFGTWPDDEVDQRVVRLLQCAQHVAENVERHVAPAVRVDVRQVQRRADSLRVVIAQRMLEQQQVRRLEQTEQLEHPERPGRPPIPASAPDAASGAATLRASAPGRSYVLRMEDHVSAGLRGVAGAEVTALEPELAAYFTNVREGLLVLRISAGTPAHRAGLAPGDVITGGNGRKLESVSELRALLAAADRQPVELRVVRKGRARTFTLPRS